MNLAPGDLARRDYHQRQLRTRKESLRGTFAVSVEKLQAWPLNKSGTGLAHEDSCLAQRPGDDEGVPRVERSPFVYGNRALQCP